ncbi:trypsin-like peptidase domain-containing protein [Stappia sp. F7233]|uniref:Trypsin-like peptidase domain-containing protein n=1 Tax=Stappia albiluteola TaxID=2758565 RepID=A0A839ACM2_9HYPH|nr:trypsin-like peptidase domain-containing protein [Stappia albiluteola]MBA5776617.1 trypsin-like peptidase domain-containing protein [Stappia albiluteola]
MRFHSGALALACMSCLLLPGAAARADPKAIADARHSVVVLLPDWPKGRVRAEEPEGSAVVVADGHWLVTADHVLGPAKGARIRLADGRLIDTEIAARDRESDLAFLRIAEALPPIEFAGDPEVATTACAIGNSFGLGVAVTCGVVSATGRGGVGFNDIEDFVQTDAAVNPGASGGALVDEYGRLIGILSAIYTKANDGDLGVNFAVSAPLTAVLLEKIQADGRLAHLRLGVSLVETRPGPEAAGLEVRAVEAGGLAEQAGLRAGDVVVAVDGAPVSSVAGLRGRLARETGGSSLKIRRAGEVADISVRYAIGDN